jgi:hypothetical protein
MLKPTAITSRSAERAKKEKKRPSPRLTKAPVQSHDATTATTPCTETR